MRQPLPQGTEDGPFDLAQVGCWLSDHFVYTERHSDRSSWDWEMQSLGEQAQGSLPPVFPKKLFQPIEALRHSLGLPTPCNHHGGGGDRHYLGRHPFLLS